MKKPSPSVGEAVSDIQTTIFFFLLAAPLVLSSWWTLYTIVCSSGIPSRSFTILPILDFTLQAASYKCLESVRPEHRVREGAVGQPDRHLVPLPPHVHHGAIHLEMVRVESLGSTGRAAPGGRVCRRAPRSGRRGSPASRCRDTRPSSPWGLP